MVTTGKALKTLELLQLESESITEENTHFNKTEHTEEVVLSLFSLPSVHLWTHTGLQSEVRGQTSGGSEAGSTAEKRPAKAPSVSVHKQTAAHGQTHTTNVKN